MTENKDNGGPAFPCDELLDQSGTVHRSEGMSLRDYFAVHASDADLKAQADILREDQRKQCGLPILPDNWTTLARYMHADAMMEARK